MQINAVVFRCSMIFPARKISAFGDKCFEELRGKFKQWTPLPCAFVLYKTQVDRWYEKVAFMQTSIFADARGGFINQQKWHCQCTGGKSANKNRQNNSVHRNMQRKCCFNLHLPMLSRDPYVWTSTWCEKEKMFDVTFSFSLITLALLPKTLEAG